MPRVASLIRLSGSEPAASSAPRAAIPACLVLLTLVAVPAGALAAPPSGPSPDPAPAQSGPAPDPAPVRAAPTRRRVQTITAAPVVRVPVTPAATAPPASAAAQGSDKRSRPSRQKRHRTRRQAPTAPRAHRAAGVATPASGTAAPVHSSPRSALRSVADSARDTGALARGGLALLALALASAALVDRIMRLRRGPRGQRERW